jgi:hypothetical protein
MPLAPGNHPQVHEMGSVVLTCQPSRRLYSHCRQAVAHRPPERIGGHGCARSRHGRTPLYSLYSSSRWDLRTMDGHASATIYLRDVSVPRSVSALHRPENKVSPGFDEGLNN